MMRRGGPLTALICVLLHPLGAVDAGAEIKALVETDGRVIFTNMAGPPPAAPSPAPVLTEAPTARTGRAARFDGLITAIGSRHNVDPALIRAVIEVESNFDRYAVSPKNARGLMQLIPETGRRFGVRDFFDPAQNIEGGVRYLRTLLNMFDGDLDLSLAAYNAGENRVARLGRIPAIPETENYVRKVRAAYGQSGDGSGALAAAGAVATSEGAGSREASSNGQVISRHVDEWGVVNFSNVGRFR